MSMQLHSASSSNPGINSVSPPSRIQLRKRSNLLELSWKDTSIELPGGELRRYCACSRCRARGLVGTLLITESQEVASVKLMGSTGLQIIFADGHDRGIFPWGYLVAISEGRALEYLDV